MNKLIIAFIIMLTSCTHHRITSDKDYCEYCNASRDKLSDKQYIECARYAYHVTIPACD